MYDFFKLAFRPRGGSRVSLLPFWRIGTGKYSAGIDVKNSLKLGLSLYSSEKPRTIF